MKPIKRHNLKVTQNGFAPYLDNLSLLVVWQTMWCDRPFDLNICLRYSMIVWHCVFTMSTDWKILALYTLYELASPLSQKARKDTDQFTHPPETTFSVPGLCYDSLRVPDMAKNMLFIQTLQSLPLYWKVVIFSTERVWNGQTKMVGAHWDAM